MTLSLTHSFVYAFESRVFRELVSIRTKYEDRLQTGGRYVLRAQPTRVRRLKHLRTAAHRSPAPGRQKLEAGGRGGDTLSLEDRTSGPVPGRQVKAAEAAMTSA